jgi:hypothetical protein
MTIKDFLAVGSTVTNGGEKKRRVADASDVTRFKRIAATFRPYIGGDVNGKYLPKGGYWGSQELRMQWSQGFRYGPIFDGTFFRPQN